MVLYLAIKFFNQLKLPFLLINFIILSQQQIPSAKIFFLLWQMTLANVTKVFN